MGAARAALIWAAVLCTIGAPILAAAVSPLLQWREPAYVAAGLAGVIGLGLMLVQPLLIGGHLPRLSLLRARLLHRWIGSALLVAIGVHVGGLWLTSPPDVVDALTFTSPTLFTPFGVIAMWAVLLAGGLALRRKSMALRVWRMGHSALVCVAVVATVVHTLLIDGTMEQITKIVICLAVPMALLGVLVARRPWRRRRA